MVKNDRWIREMAEKGMIKPFNKHRKKKGINKYRIKSYRYNNRIKKELKIREK